MKQIVFRADASVMIGSGHIMRCLTLADRLAARGAEIFFVCRQITEPLVQMIEDRNYRLFMLNYVYEHNNEYLIDAEFTCDILQSISPTIDCLIVDQYQFDYRWEEIVNPHTDSLMVIDDLADRKHSCDLLLDQNYYSNRFERYSNLVPMGCVLFLGPSYALLRPEFCHPVSSTLRGDTAATRILVSFGGSDSTNETAKTIKALNKIRDIPLSIDIVLGSSSPHIEEVRLLCAQSENIHMHVQVDYMSKLMASSDLAIGSGGSTTWERIMMALPTMTIIVAENQRQMTEDLAHEGAIINFGWYNQIDVDELSEKISVILHNPSILDSVREISKNLISLDMPNGMETIVNAILRRSYVK